MSDLVSAQERLEAAIMQLEKALDARANDDGVAVKDAKLLHARTEAVSKRLDAAIERLQALLGT